MFRRENLYNTNEKFDYGGFRELMEQMSQAQSASTIFTFRFNDPGVYAFYLSSDINQKMVKLFNICIIILFWLLMFDDPVFCNLPSCNKRNSKISSLSKVFAFIKLVFCFFSIFGS